MKVPTILDKFLPREVHPQQMFLSLVIIPDEILGAVWNESGVGKTEIAATTEELVTTDSWEERIISADKVISILEEKVPGTELSKVVLGLPADYLTETGDVEPDVKPQIKKLTTELDLEPIGFVAIHQALIHKLKLDEGVPASVILVDVKKTGLTIHLYKVGNLLGSKTIGRDDIVTHVEDVLKSFTDLEVLPSRILLFGSDTADLEETKRLLMKHPWPTRANFLHFPKIEIEPEDAISIAVSLAGASEMRNAGNLAEEVVTTPQVEEKVIAQPEISKEFYEKSEAEVEPEAVAETEADEAEKSFEAEEVEPEITEEPNVEMVAPEALGFKKSEDVLEKSQISNIKSQKLSKVEEKEEIEEDKTKFKIPLPVKIPSFDFSRISAVFSAIPVGGNKLPLVGAGVLVILFLFAAYWLFPHARVTVLQLTKSVDETATFTVDSTATVADAATKIIPGQKQEQSVSGDKTVAATGKKQVGDPAKGAIIIYNKDTNSARTFPKGSVMTAGSLHFTLDNDVIVASASQTFGSDFLNTTFSKASANITATQIGTASNLPANTEFDFQDFATSIAVGRNDQPLSGGTSKNVTVVSRNDYDTLTKSLTGDLVAKAKAQLASSVSGQKRLIDDTVDATVTQKDFSQEIDQQASQLHGSLTVTVSGLAYNEDDVLTLMKGLVGDKLPSGYSFPSSGEIKVTKTTVKKDGTVVASVNYHAEATPTFDIAGIQKNLAGKSLKSAQEYLKTITGVGGAEFGFSWNIFGKQMPANPKNISVSIGTQ